METRTAYESLHWIEGHSMGKHTQSCSTPLSTTAHSTLSPLTHTLPQSHTHTHYLRHRHSDTHTHLANRRVFGQSLLPLCSSLSKQQHSSSHTHTEHSHPWPPGLDPTSLTTSQTIAKIQDTLCPAIQHTHTHTELSSHTILDWLSFTKARDNHTFVCVHQKAFNRVCLCANVQISHCGPWFTLW